MKNVIVITFFGNKQYLKRTKQRKKNSQSELWMSQEYFDPYFSIFLIQGQLRLLVHCMQ
ncbi:unnamed protein product [Paramecium octaurelia]|uniref:Uncharacterized protein n=1 Tax=Paramecium octaurelia TaxID=43137 RepID=A0A8S1VY51_PAROT|nr:unnamed protein product [Paramecium octaurelia]